MIPILVLVVLVMLGIVEHVWVLGALFAAWYGLVNGGRYIAVHPWQAIGYSAAYFLVGAVWSIVKWWRYEVEQVEQARERFAGGRFSAMTWETYSREHRSQVADYKGIITAWITFWPFSALWTLLDDPIRRLCARIYKELYAVYQRISDRVWA